MTSREQLIGEPFNSYCLFIKLFLKITFYRIWKKQNHSKFTSLYVVFLPATKLLNFLCIVWLFLWIINWSTLYPTINQQLVVYWQVVKMIQTMQMAALWKLPLQTIAETKRSLWGGIAQSRANFAREHVSWRCFCFIS